MFIGAGYDDEKVVRLTKEAIDQGFNHFKVKVGISPEDDARRLALVRSVIDDPANFENRKVTPSAASLEGKNASATGCVLMMDANQGEDGKLSNKDLIMTSFPLASQYGMSTKPLNGVRSCQNTIYGSLRSQQLRTMYLDTLRLEQVSRESWVSRPESMRITGALQTRSVRSGRADMPPR